MRLKRIELAGFKSFVDPTRIDLDQGITAIVGPNGCGKSNIVDALRWVLGEHSARHLRGGIMDDLIFQGSESRAPVAICDVELTFNIEKGSLSSPYHQLHEIRVRRRLTREGNSDAFINGKMVRIKDVVDLFLDTGISTRAYAIIEQGSIARMVTAKAEERRVIFEEAAGVMKYRSRRREAERRMKDTRSNLDRILDLLEEVRSQCRSLKKQSTQAERFKTLQHELNQLQSLILALRHQALQDHYQHIELQLIEAKRKESESVQQLNVCKNSVNKARLNLINHEQETVQAQNDLRSSEQYQSDLQQQVERAIGQRQLLSERKETLNHRLHEKQEQQQRLTNELKSITAQLARKNDSALQEQQQQSSAAVEEYLVYFRNQRKRRDQLLTKFERFRLTHKQAILQHQNSEQTLNRLKKRDLQLNKRLSDLSNQLQQHLIHIKTASQQKISTQQAQKATEQTLKMVQIELDHCRQTRETTAQAFHLQESSLSEYKGISQELRGRIKTGDISNHLRDVFKAKGGLWIDESLHVPAGLEAAVSAALRGRFADVLLPSNTSPADVKKLLKQTNREPIALFNSAHALPDSSNNNHSSLATAIGISSSHPLYDLFSPVQLVENMTDHINSRQQQNICCVSRDGWRLETNGWLIPPSENHTAHRLTTQRALRESEANIKQAEAKLQQSRKTFALAENKLEQTQKDWQQSHILAVQAESEHHAADAVVQRNQTEISSLQEQRQHLQADLTQIGDEKHYWQKQIKEASDIDQLSSLQQQTKDNLADQDQVLKQAEKRLDQTRQSKAQAEQVLALFIQERKSLTQQCKRLKQEDTLLKSKIKTDKAHLQQAAMELVQVRNHDALDQQLAHAVSAVQAAHQTMNAVRHTAQALQQLQLESERSERQSLQVMQLTSSQRQSIEMKQAQYAARLQDCDAEIQQRFQTSPAQLLLKTEHMHAGHETDQHTDIEQIGSADSIMQHANKLEQQINRFGPVNLLAIDEFEQANERKVFLTSQVADLEMSLSTLNDTIERIDRTTKQRLQEVFEQTNAYFKQTFPQLFGGGRAELKLDHDDILKAGVEIIAQPPGKRLQDVGLLSGGEKALTAVALVFSIFKIKPAPFCVLDEVDAPLDDANAVRFGEMVRELSDQVQFLSISHNKISMQKADRLIGISMPEPGVSKIISVDLKPSPLKVSELA